MLPPSRRPGSRPCARVWARARPRRGRAGRGRLLGPRPEVSRWGASASISRVRVGAVSASWQRTRASASQPVEIVSVLASPRCGPLPSTKSGPAWGLGPGALVGSALASRARRSPRGGLRILGVERGRPGRGLISRARPPFPDCCKNTTPTSCSHRNALRRLLVRFSGRGVRWVPGFGQNAWRGSARAAMGLL